MKKMLAFFVLIYIPLSSWAAPKDVVETYMKNANEIVRQECIRPEFSIPQGKECLANQTEQSFKNFQDSLKKLKDLNKVPGSPLRSLMGDDLEEDKEGSLVVRQARFQNSLEKLIREKPEALKQIPDLDNFLKDLTVYNSARRTFRIVALDKDECIHPELSFQDESIPELKGKKCKKTCEIKKKAKTSGSEKGSHLYCQKYEVGAKGSAQKIAAKDKNAHIQSCMMEEPFLKDAPLCAAPLGESTNECVVGDFANSVGLQGGKETVAALLQSSGACGYMQILRMRAVSQLIESYKDLVDEKVPMPQGCKENFADLFDNAGKRDKKNESSNYVKPHRIGNYPSLIRASAIKVTKHLEKITQNDNARLDLFKVRNSRPTGATKEELDEYARLESENEQLRNEVAEEYGKYPYLSIRDSEESPYSQTKIVNFFANEKSDEVVKNKVFTLKSHVGSDLQTSMEQFCKNENQGGISGKDLVSNSTLTQAVLAGDKGLGNLPGFSNLQSCLSNAAGNNTVQMAGTIGITGACLTASLMAAPSIVGSFVIGAGCGAISIMMTLNDQRDGAEKALGVEACRKAGAAVCDVQQYRSAITALEDEQRGVARDIGLETASNLLPLAAGSMGIVLKGLKALKASGDVKQVTRTEAAISQLRNSTRFKTVAKEQKIELLADLIKKEGLIVDEAELIKLVDELPPTKGVIEISEALKTPTLSSKLKSTMDLFGQTGKTKMNEFLLKLSETKDATRTKFLTKIKENRWTPEKIKKLIDDALEAGKSCK